MLDARRSDACAERVVQENGGLTESHGVSEMNGGAGAHFTLLSRPQKTPQAALSHR